MASDENQPENPNEDSSFREEMKKAVHRTDRRSVQTSIQTEALNERINELEEFIRDNTDRKEFANEKLSEYLDYVKKDKTWIVRRIITGLAIIYSISSYALLAYLFVYTNNQEMWFHKIKSDDLKTWIVIALIASSTALITVMLRGVYQERKIDITPENIRTILQNFQGD